jgi:hypothetical protein
LLSPGLGAGWLFGDGAALEARWGDTPANSAATYRMPVFEDENYRCSAVFGTWVGALQEWYLGRGFAAGLEVGVPRARVCLVWYDDEGVAYTLGIDLLRGCLDLDWALAF